MDLLHASSPTCWRPDPAEVAVWLFPALDHLPGSAGDFDVLGNDERAIAARFRFTGDRALYLQAHVSLRQILAMQCGVPAKHLKFKRGPGGKPHLVCPQGTGPHALQFNLSHTRGWIAVVTTSGVALGVDVEVARPLYDLGSMAASVLSPWEAQALSELSGEEAVHDFMRVWTGKEAYAKALGQGLRIPLAGLTLARSASGSFQVLEGWPPQAIGACDGQWGCHRFDGGWLHLSVVQLGKARAVRAHCLDESMAAELMRAAAVTRPPARVAPSAGVRYA